MQSRAFAFFVVSLPSVVQGQRLDPGRHRFTADVRVLSPSEYLPRDILRTMLRTGAQLPDSVAVGSLNGVTFFYRTRPSGLVATAPNADWEQMSRTNSWAVDCTRDAIDDSLTCRLAREDLLVVVRGSTVAVLVGAGHYPSSDVAIRIDDAPPFRGTAPGFTDSAAAEILARLHTGDSVVTRFRQWPSQAPVDKKMGLYGLKEALLFLEWLMRTLS